MTEARVTKSPVIGKPSRGFCSGSGLGDRPTDPQRSGRAGLRRPRVCWLSERFPGRRQIP